MLAILPDRTGGAAENMATDFLLLQRAATDHPMLRHYEWRRPAFTFGYSQKLTFIQSQLPADEPVDLCRRPTGGGLVDHRDDWTYSLIVPRTHPLYAARAIESYRAVHAGVAEALVDLGCSALLKTECEPCAPGTEPGPAGVCFKRPELYDVIHAQTGEKIAGAAQKRAKRGLLFQGSLWRPAAPNVDWDAFSAAFSQRLATILGGEAKASGWPFLEEEELSGLIENYSEPSWNALR
ncbi:MAG TPA: lipoate--protein ligase family protein [Opitutaceae bacterium]